MELTLLTGTDVAACLAMPRAIELMRDAFASLSAGSVDSPVRTVLNNDHGTVLYKPAYADLAGLFCAKIVSVFRDNARRGLPVTPGLIVVNDAQTGMPLAIMEAGYLTSLRTGAATGLVTDLLAPPQAAHAALFGTGGQAMHQLEAMLHVRALESVCVYSRQRSNAESFCDRAAARWPACSFLAPSDRSALRTCEVVTTATTSPTPVFQDAELGDIVHINAIGSLGPQRSEIPEPTIERATIVVDQREACLQEAGELLPLIQDGRLPPDFAPVEIGEILAAADYRPDRSVTVFKSVGNAAQDLVCAAEVLAVAQARGLGSTVSL